MENEWWRYELGPFAFVTTLLFFIPVLWVPMTFPFTFAFFYSNGREGCDECSFCSIWKLQVVNSLSPYRISSPNSWMSHFLTSWVFRIHKVMANGNGSMILLSVKMSGECSPRLMQHWDYLHWKCRENLPAVTIIINDCN